MYTRRTPPARSTFEPTPPPHRRRLPPSVRAPRRPRAPDRTPPLDLAPAAGRLSGRSHGQGDRLGPRSEPDPGPSGGECPGGRGSITPRRGVFSQSGDGRAGPARRPVTAGRPDGPRPVGDLARPVRGAGRHGSADPGAAVPGRKGHRTARTLREPAHASRQFGGGHTRSACAWISPGDPGSDGGDLDPGPPGRGRARGRPAGRRARAGPRRHPGAPRRRRLAEHPGGPRRRTDGGSVAGPAAGRGDPAAGRQGPARARPAAARSRDPPGPRARRGLRAPHGWASRTCARGEAGAGRGRLPRRPDGWRGGRAGSPAVEPPRGRPVLAGRASGAPGPRPGGLRGEAGARRGSGGAGASARTPALRPPVLRDRQGRCSVARS